MQRAPSFVVVVFVVGGFLFAVVVIIAAFVVVVGGAVVIVAETNRNRAENLIKLAKTGTTTKLSVETECLIKLKPRLGGTETGLISRIKP